MTNDIRFAGTQAVRTAEQLPLASLDTISRMKDGQALMVQTPTGVQVVVLAGPGRYPPRPTLPRPRPTRLSHRTVGRAAKHGAAFG